MDEVLRCRGDPLPGCITIGADNRRGLELLDRLRGFRTIVAVRASIGMIQTVSYLPLDNSLVCR
jgi:hypothetical protein